MATLNNNEQENVCNAGSNNEASTLSDPLFDSNAKKETSYTNVKAPRVVVPDGLSPAEHARMMSKLGKGMGGKQTECFVVRKRGETKCFTADELSNDHTVYFNSCEDCQWEITSTVTKILIEDCHRCTLILRGQVLTSTAEVWKCNSLNMMLFAPLHTVQVDLCDDVRIEFGRKEDLEQVVWAATERLHVSIRNSDRPEMVTGLQQMKETGTVEREDIDQFKTHWNDGHRRAIITEKLVRLENGHTTTPREKEAFDAKEKRDQKKMDAYIKKITAETERKHGAVAVKPGRNDPCTCQSGLKYKKCCGK